MRLSILGFFVFAILAFTSCQKENGEMSDAQLVDAIQKASKQNIDIADLPDPSKTTLNTDYTDDYVELAKLAPKLGYEVDIRKEKGPRVGERGQAYFDLNGRELKGDRGKGDKDDEDKGEGDKKECFELVLPVTFTMPDGSEITIEDKEDWELIKNWYEVNPDYDERPQLQFPVDIEYRDGNVVTINNEEEMRAAFEECKGDEGDEHKRKCFDLVLPVTFTMPDGTEIIVEEREDYGLIKAWYEEHPDYNERPTLKFPVDIEWKDGTLQTINNVEEMREAKEKCGDGEGHRKRCFELVLPVTLTMPDGSEITIESKEDRMLIKQWYKEHPDVEERPAMNYPVDIKYKDGTIVTINNDEEMMEARKECGGDMHKKRCFELVLPVTYIMPDESEIIIENKEDRILIKEWYINHPDVNEKPTLDYPVDIKYFEDGTVLTINNKEEMISAKEECKEGDQD